MADPDFPIRAGGGGHPGPGIGEGGRSQKCFFRPFEPQFGLVAKRYFRNKKKRTMLIVIIEKKNYHGSGPPKYRTISI